MKSLLKNKKFKKFIVVGGTAALIDFSVFFLLTSYFHTSILFANICSTSIAFCFSFIANKTYTFQTKDRSILRELLLFIIVTLVGLWGVQTIIVVLSHPLIHQLVENNDIALLFGKIIAAAVGMIWNYFFYSRFVFINKGVNR